MKIGKEASVAVFPLGPYYSRKAQGFFQGVCGGNPHQFLDKWAQKSIYLKCTIPCVQFLAPSNTPQQIKKHLGVLRKIIFARYESICL